MKAMFEAMTTKEIRAWIYGAHQSKEYDAYFEAACSVLNSRTK